MHRVKALVPPTDVGRDLDRAPLGLGDPTSTPSGLPSSRPSAAPSETPSRFPSTPPSQVGARLFAYPGSAPLQWIAPSVNFEDRVRAHAA